MPLPKPDNRTANAIPAVISFYKLRQIFVQKICLFFRPFSCYNHLTKEDMPWKKR